MIFIKTLSRICVSLFFIFLVPLGHTQGEPNTLDERYDNWFQIELIIFDRNASGGANEIWPNNIELAYPRQLDFLFTQEEWDAFTAPLPPEATSEQGIQAQDSSRFSDRIPSQQTGTGLSNTLGNSDDADVQASPNNSMAFEHGAEASPQDGADEFNGLPEMETPRIILDDTVHQLKSESARLRRRPDFRILFHETWRQEILSKEESVDIALKGGNPIEAHYELEGSIKLHLGRYLHIETNLWRNFFVPNYGQELKYWPTLPTLPQPIREDIANTVTIESEFGLDINNENFDSSNSLNGFNFERGLDTDTNAFNLKLDSNLNNQLTERNRFGMNHSLEIESANLVSEIITLKQKRRMRSNELHYIDHPRLGIIVYISPYEVPLAPISDAQNTPPIEVDPIP